MQGKEGLVPSNYFDAPVVEKKELDADFDAKVSWSQTLPQVTPKAQTQSTAPPDRPAKAVEKEKPAAAAASSHSVDSFGLDAWAKEMEMLLLSVPGPNERKTQVEPKTVEAKIDVKKEEVKKVEVHPEVKKEEPAKVQVVAKPEVKKEEPPKVDQNDEWIVWMQRAIQAEQDIKVFFLLGLVFFFFCLTHKKGLGECGGGGQAIFRRATGGSERAGDAVSGTSQPNVRSDSEGKGRNRGTTSAGASSRHSRAAKGRKGECRRGSESSGRAGACQVTAFAFFCGEVCNVFLALLTGGGKITR